MAAAAAGFAYAMTGPADRSPSSAEAFATVYLRRLLIPLHARSIQPPPTISTASLVEGRTLYRERCSICHGGTGKADASLSKSFYPPAPDLTSSAMRHWSDRDLYWTIQNGIRMTGMPAWRSVLNDQQTWDLVAYIRRLSKQDPPSHRHSVPTGDSDAELRALAIQTIDDEGCQDCHTINGVGAKIGPNLSDEWARGRSDDWLIRHFRNPAAVTPGTLMPSFNYLSDQQLKALVRYLLNPEK
ncbi:MAG: c-type cytochrome [Terriglobales bacterium]